jgi:hypothetical protein
MGDGREGALMLEMKKIIRIRFGNGPGESNEEVPELENGLWRLGGGGERGE